MVVILVIINVLYGNEDIEEGSRFSQLVFIVGWTIPFLWFGKVFWLTSGFTHTLI